MDRRQNTELLALVQSAGLREDLPLTVFPQGPQPLSDARTLRGCAERYLTRFGCILFRGFALGEPGALTRFVKAFNYATHETEVLGSRAPARVMPRLFMPPRRRFELICTHTARTTRGAVVWLHCRTGRPRLYEAVVADQREVYRRLSLSTRTALLGRGLRFTRTLPCLGPRGWQAAFGTRERTKVDTWCRLSAVACTWLAGDALQLTRVEPALGHHPDKGEAIWASPLLTSLLFTDDAATRRTGGSLLELHHADGSPLASAHLENVRAAVAASASVIPWERGDILMLDPQLLWQASVPHLFESEQHPGSGNNP